MKRCHRAVLFLAIVALAAIGTTLGARQPAVPADRPVARTDPHSLTAHAQLLEKKKRGRIDVYFAGDSINSRWGAIDYPDLLANWRQNFHGWNAANFGWGGDTASAIAQPAPAVAAAPFGKLDDTPVQLYTLTNRHGLIARITNLGAIITELHIPDRAGTLADVVLGFEDLDGYLTGHPYFGAIVGRVANRIANAEFTLGGARYTLAANDRPHHLHGGRRGWDKVVWNARPLDTADGPALELTYVSKEGEEGYPGTVTARTVYTLTNDNELIVEMQATADKTTLVNMAHHSYWNLGGHDSGTILDHELTLYADRYTPGTPMVPDGRIAPVEGTPFDFTRAKAIDQDLKDAGGTPIGYDHNFVVNGERNQLRPVARLEDPKSGRVMTLSADQPGVQFYTGNFLDGSHRGKGATYVQYAGLCLETQKFPNAINVPAWADQVIVSPGQTYRHVMVHRFSTEP